MFGRSDALFWGTEGKRVVFEREEKEMRSRQIKTVPTTLRDIMRDEDFERGVIDVELPAAAPPTLYTSLGDWTILLLWAAVAAAAILGRRRNPGSAAPQ